MGAPPVALQGGAAMNDLIMLGLVAAFALLSWGFVALAERV
jgi:hypothetical protein